MTANRTWRSLPTKAHLILLGNGGGTFQAAVSYPNIWDKRHPRSSSLTSIWMGTSIWPSGLSTVHPLPIRLSSTATATVLFRLRHYLSMLI
jgi:hypothetical protein